MQSGFNDICYKDIRGEKPRGIATETHLFEIKLFQVKVCRLDCSNYSRFLAKVVIFLDKTRDTLAMHTAYGKLQRKGS